MHKACRGCGQVPERCERCEPDKVAQYLSEPFKLDSYNKTQEATICAAERGFTVTPEGDVISSTGRKLKLAYKHNPAQDGKGKYYRFSISVGSRSEGRWTGKIQVHQFIAYLKFGEVIFRPDMQVRHLNGNSLDNRWSNICFGTASDNMMDIEEETRVEKAGQAGRSYDDDFIQELVDRRKEGATYKQLMAEFGITSKGTLSYLLNKSVASNEARGGEALGHKRRFTDEEEQDIVELYQGGESLVAIRSKYGITSHGTIYAVLKKHGIKADRAETKRKG